MRMTDNIVEREVRRGESLIKLVREALEKAGVEMVSAEIDMIAQTYAKIESDDDIKKMKKLLALLDDEDDVQDVYHNWENEG